MNRFSLFQRKVSFEHGLDVTTTRISEASSARLFEITASSAR